MDGINKSTVPSDYFSLDEMKEKKGAAHSGREVSVSSDDEVFIDNDDPDIPRKSISDFRVGSLNSNDSGQFSLSDDLEFASKIGAGGFGSVWLVQSEDGSDKYAFKLPYNSEAMTSELEKMDTAGEHRNIMKSFGLAEIDGKQGILMEYVPGEDLSGLLPEMTSKYLQGTLSHSQFWGSIQYILKETLSGIRHLEKQGCAHQDIKLQNIRVHEEKLIPVIIDFGNLTRFGERGSIGTELYSTPESLSDPDEIEVSDKFDSYSIGQITYSLLSGVVNPGVDSFFTAGAEYDDLAASERAALLFRLHLAMKEFQQSESSGEYQQALKPISGDELDKSLQEIFADSEKLTKAMDRAYSKPGNENIPLDIMLEKELPETLLREGMVGHYRSGYQSSLTQFINRALHPDPELRLNASEALKQEFITDPLIDDESARKVIGSVLAMKS